MKFFAPTRRPFAFWAVLATARLGFSGAGAFWGGDSSSLCASKDSCKDDIARLILKLEEADHNLHDKNLTLNALKNIRSSVLQGEKVALPSAQRQHLPALNEISYDAKHAPYAQHELDRHLVKVGELKFLEAEKPSFIQFLPVKNLQSSASKKKDGQMPKGPTGLILAVHPHDKPSQLSIFTSPQGERIFGPFDLGHSKGGQVQRYALSGKHDDLFLLTAGEDGLCRVNDLKVNVEKPSKKKEGEEGHALEPKVSAAAVFSASFSIPQPTEGGEQRRLTSILPVERGSSQAMLAVGDQLGGISLFYRNGTFKARTQVTEEEGGIVSLQRGQASGTLIYLSTRSFGFFSASQMELSTEPCGGWESPAVYLAADSSYANRVMVALKNGQILIFSIQGKTKTCDLHAKLPTISQMPAKVNVLKGHALVMPFPKAPEHAKQRRELLVFNLPAIEQGYGSGASKAVELQIPFAGNPNLVTINPSVGGAKSSQLAVLLESGDVHVYDFSLKTATAPTYTEDGGTNWLDYFPKWGMFGIALVGVILWNVRKVTAQKAKNQAKSKFDDNFDEDYFREQVRKSRENRAKAKAKAGNLRAAGNAADAAEGAEDLEPDRSPGPASPSGGAGHDDDDDDPDDN